MCTALSSQSERAGRPVQSGSATHCWHILILGQCGEWSQCGCFTQTPGACKGKSELTEAACTPNSQGKMSTELKRGWSRPSAREGNYGVVQGDEAVLGCPVYTGIWAINQLNSFIVLCSLSLLQWQVQDKLCGADQVWCHCQFPFLVILLLI